MIKAFLFTFIVVISQNQRCVAKYLLAVQKTFLYENDGIIITKLVTNLRLLLYVY